MAIYGATHLQFTPFAAGAEETINALPEYDTTKTVELGALVAVTATPNIAEGKQYGNNVLKEYVGEFSEGTVDADVTDITPANAKLVYGATVDGGKLVYKDNDMPPYGALSFICCLMVDGEQVYEPHVLTKVKAKRGEITANTKQQNVTFSVPKISFVWASPACHKYEIVSRVSTEEGALAWIESVLADSSATTLESIEITTAPTKTSYTAGESFDPTGMEVAAAYSDGDTADVTSLVSVIDGEDLTAGKTSVTIGYSEGGVIRLATQAITVSAS